MNAIFTATGKSVRSLPVKNVKVVQRRRPEMLSSAGAPGNRSAPCVWSVERCRSVGSSWSLFQPNPSTRATDQCRVDAFGKLGFSKMLRLAIGLLSLFFILSSAASAEKRAALVIGNSAYTKVPKLENPKNDAAAIEAMLKAAGFDAVVRVNDLGGAAMRRALRDFSDTILDADVAVVFYAGHGMEVGGVNYLIPTDAVLERDIDAQDEAVSLDRVIQILEPAKRLRLVILDACRDNPFVRSMRRTVATRAIRSGYGEIDERSLSPNTLVAYAQRAGGYAEDGAGANSPYTTALLKHLPTPGLDIELALRRVRDEVLMSTRNRQEPFRYGSLGGAEIALVAGKTSPIATTSPSAAPLSEAERAWGLAKDTNSVAVLESYADRYKGTFYADLARARIENLKRQQLAVTAAPPPTRMPDPMPAALTEQAPATYKARFDTSKGVFVIDVRREWAPLAADRFYNLVKNGFYDDNRFFRVISGFMVQFGINGNPQVSTPWRNAQIKDDPVKQSNKRGFITFATAGPNSRTTQVFINFGDNARLDNLGFAPFGEVTTGMNVVEQLYSDYGEGAPNGRGPNQGRLQSEGNTYLAKEFPNLDFVRKASIGQ
jgi:uncharacterized caspase-like protein/cyclophilin family peptidyl-prolyl cis-trans isomerase